MEEIWKDIKGYEGLYQVSNLGRIKCMQKTFNAGRYNAKMTRKEKIMNTNINSKTGYVLIGLIKNKIRKTKTLWKDVLK